MVRSKKSATYLPLSHGHKVSTTSFQLGVQRRNECVSIWLNHCWNDMLNVQFENEELWAKPANRWLWFNFKGCRRNCHWHFNMWKGSWVGYDNTFLSFFLIVLARSNFDQFATQFTIIIQFHINAKCFLSRGCRFIVLSKANINNNNKYSYPWGFIEV